jgi:hypothetical protein
VRPTARRAFVIGTRLVAASVAIQFLLAGIGVFYDWTSSFFWHANINGAIVFFLPLLMILAGWYGRLPSRLLWMTAAIPGLVIVQSLLLVPYHMHATGVVRAISALHVVNGLFIFWVAVQLVDRTRTLEAPAQA